MEDPVLWFITSMPARTRCGCGIQTSVSRPIPICGLQAPSNSSVLSGSATVSRIVFNANTDVGNVLSAFAAPVPTPANQKDLLTGLRLDIGIESAPDLQISTALSRDVEAGIDLRLRGTPDRPVLLGSVSANQGDIRAFGTRYSINHGQINFINTSKIEPVLDLDLQTPGARHYSRRDDLRYSQPSEHRVSFRSSFAAARTLSRYLLSDELRKRLLTYKPLNRLHKPTVCNPEQTACLARRWLPLPAFPNYSASPTSNSIRWFKGSATRLSRGLRSSSRSRARLR